MPSWSLPDRTAPFFNGLCAIGYEANPNIYERLCRALGVSNREDLLQALSVDERPVMLSYIGPPLLQQRKNRIVDLLEGYVMRRMEHTRGFIAIIGYWSWQR